MDPAAREIRKSIGGLPPPTSSDPILQKSEKKALADFEALTRVAAWSMDSLARNGGSSSVALGADAPHPIANRHLGVYHERITCSRELSA